MSRRRSLVVIGGSAESLLLLKKAAHLGLACIVVDRNRDAPAARVADARVVLSTWEADPVVAALSGMANAFDIVGVATRSSGPAVVTAALVAEYFGVPGPTARAARLANHKSLFMDTCAANGIPVPRRMGVGPGEGIPAGWDVYPCVVKPSLAVVGKRGVRVVRRPEDLPAAVEHALSFTLDGRAEVQAFVEGSDVTLLALVHRGRLLAVALFDEVNAVTASGGVEGRGLRIPSEFAGTDAEERFKVVAQRVVEALGVDTGPLLLSYRYARGAAHPVVIEAHLDFGGDRILDDLLPRSTAFDFPLFALRALTGEGAEAPRVALAPVLLSPSGSRA